MVDDDIGSTDRRTSLAIDEAIGLLDSIVLRLQTPGKPAEEKPTSVPALGPPPKTPRKGHVIPSENSPDLSNSAAGQQESKLRSLLDRPGKTALKLPGASSTGVTFKSGAVAKDSNEQGLDYEINFDKAQFQVGLVHSVDVHPIAEKLYVCKVEISSGYFKQVVAGLRKYVPATELGGKKVALILNLKPAKLAGQLSEGMILAGESLVDGERTVKTLEPPPSASVGERIYLEGRNPSVSPAKQLSSKIWEKIQPLLKVEGGVATFNQVALVTSSGPLQVSGLSDGAGIR